jgi:hypothetical protein
MNDQQSFEREVATWIAAEGTGTAPVQILDDILTATSRKRPLPGWLALIKEPPMRISNSVAVGSPMVRVAAIMVATLLLAIMVAGAGLAGSRLLAAGELNYTFERFVIGDEDTRPSGVAQLPTGEIAVTGFDDGTEANMVWSSADGGQTWTTTLTDVALGDVVAFEDRFIALGDASPFDDEAQSGLRMASLIWSSADGLAWDQIATLEDANVHSLRVTPDGLVALGLDHRADDGSLADSPPGYPTLWVSQDGIDWIANEISAPLPVGTPARGDSSWAFFMDGPVRSADGVWLAGATYEDSTSGSDKSIVWRSPDGAQWDVVMEPEGESGLGFLAGTPEAFMAMVWTDDGPELLTSTNGIDWEPFDLGDLEDGGDPVVSDSAGLIAFVHPFNPFDAEDVFPLEVPMYRFAENSAWEAVSTGITNFEVALATVTSDGRLFLGGSDLNDCELSSCLIEPGGDKAAIWIGTPE